MKITVKFSVWKKLKVIAEDERERKIDDHFLFHKFMRDGKCGEEYNEVLKCAKYLPPGEELKMRKCGDEFMALAKCCLTHEDYYWPIMEKDNEVSQDFFDKLRVKYRKEREQFLEDLKRD